jgi:hypothetical protein
MGILSFLKSKRSVGISPNSLKYGGIIKQLELESFWDQLTEEDKSTFRMACKRSFGASCFELGDVDAVDSTLGTRRHPSSFLSGIAVWIIEMKKYKLAESVLLEAVNLAPDTISIHTSYKWLVRIHEQLRQQELSSHDSCIYYCKRDIQLYPQLIRELKERNLRVVKPQSFTILSTIYKESNMEKECSELTEFEQYCSRLH